MIDKTFADFVQSRLNTLFAYDFPALEFGPGISQSLNFNRITRNKWRKFGAKI